jgi:hypothetical protein
MHRPWTTIYAVITVMVCLTIAGAQEKKKPVPMTASARLAAAKTAFVKMVGGSDIPYNVFSSSLEGWGRLALVSAPEKADIILEIYSPDADGGITVSSSTNRSALSGKDEHSTTTSRQVSSSPIRLIVYDSKSKIALWSASEQPKFAMKQKGREDNLVEASQRLFSKFRERMEPTPAQ